MDFENDKKVTSSSSSSSSIVPSVLQSDEMFSSRILGRQSTIGSCSSRIYYRPVSEGVPFQWEKQPGKPIEPPPDSVLPPLSPPPAVLAMGFHKPCFDVDVEDDDKKANKARRWSKAWLVKNIKEKMDVRKALVGYYSKKVCNINTQGGGKFGSERYHSARFSNASFTSTSTFSSTTNYSFRENHHSKDDRQISKELSKEKPFTCNPRGLSDVVIYFVKRS